MNKFKFYFILSITTVVLFSCNNNNNDTIITPPREYAAQYKVDSLDIESYLKLNTIKIINKPDFPDDPDVVIEPITDRLAETSIYSYLDATTFPKLLSRNVSLHNITYKLYYLVLREGIGESPTNVDKVLAAYRGDYLSRTTTATNPLSLLTATNFDENKSPHQFFDLAGGVITGWSEAFPKFKTGTVTENDDGTVTYKDFGFGVMFLPSGLGYYDQSSSKIPAYSPLVFSFKLYKIQRGDHDGDGIPSFQEELNGDGYLYTVAVGENKITDTDGDGIADFLDVDDDGDNYSTKLEITKPGGSNLLLDGPSLYYPYDPIVSDPIKTTDEKRGVPEYSATGTPDYTTAKRIRLHLDKDHHTATP